ncbi:MAG: HEAT repeat domain-containing protein [Nitrospiraceae bacterium]|nr:HEAT repeat domain-containing protein [Nitrospiraceae bacterium]
MNIVRKLATAAVLLFLPVAVGAPAFAADRDTLLRELKGDDWEVRLMKKDADALTDRQSVESLIRLIRNAGLDWRLQIRGIRVLGELHTAAAEEALIQMFSDVFFHQGCPAVKTSLARALGNFRDPRVVSALLEKLDDSELPVRAASIVSLGRVGDAAAVPYLIERLNDPSFMIRSSAIVALGQLGDTRALPALEKTADSDSEPLLRMEARAALTRVR